MEIKKVQYNIPLGAVQVTAENMIDVAAWCRGEAELSGYEEDSCVLVDGDCGSTPAFVGWWVVWDGLKEEFSVVPKELFAKAYTSVEN